MWQGPKIYHFTFNANILVKVSKKFSTNSNTIIMQDPIIEYVIMFIYFIINFGFHMAIQY